MARMKLGLFEGVKGSVTGLIGAGVYHTVAGCMGWTQPDVLQAAVILGVGRFFYGLSVADSFGNDYVQCRFSYWTSINLGSEYITQAVTILGNAIMTPNTNSIMEAERFINGGAQSYLDTLFTYSVLFSSAKNVVSGLVGYKLLECMVQAGTLTFPLQQLMLNAAIGAVTQEVILNVF